MTSLAGSLAGGVAGPLSGLGAGAAGGTIEDILGDLLVEHWDARYGVNLVGGAVDSWVGQKTGAVLSAAATGARPAYASDGVFFRGRNVLQTDGVENTLQLIAGSPLVAAGTRPFVFVVARQPVLYTGALGYVFALSDFASQEMGIVLASNGAGQDDVRGYAYPQGSASYVDGQDLESHVWFAGLRVTGDGMALARDGIVVATAAGGATVAGMHAVFLSRAFYFAAVHFAAVGICSAEPSLEQLEALLALLSDTWGTELLVTLVTAGETLVKTGEEQVTAGGGVEQWRSIMGT